jgi:hypothetical protein
LGKSQKNICGTVILSVAPMYDIREDDGTTSALVKCSKNLSQEVISPTDELNNPLATDAVKVVEHFKENVLCLINDNKKSDVVLALKDIIANDTHIKPDTVVDKVTGLTKAEIGSTDTFIIENFLAGVFLYIVTVVENTVGKVTVGTIDDKYISQFANRDCEVRFVDKLIETLKADETEPYAADVDSEVVDGIRIESDSVPNLQQNIYNQTIDVKGNNNLVNGFVFNLNNRGERRE